MEQHKHKKKTWQIENGKGICFPFFGGEGWNLELRDSVRVLIWDADRKKTWLSRTHCCDIFWGFTSLSSWISSWPCLPNVYFVATRNLIYIETNLRTHHHHDHLISYILLIHINWLHEVDMVSFPRDWPLKHTKRRGPWCQLCPTLCKIRGGNPLKRHVLKDPLLAMPAIYFPEKSWDLETDLGFCDSTVAPKLFPHVSLSFLFHVPFTARGS